MQDIQGIQCKYNAIHRCIPRHVGIDLFLTFYKENAIVILLSDHSSNAFPAT
jgi:hypothetical protein